MRLSPRILCIFISVASFKAYENNDTNCLCTAEYQPLCAFCPLTGKYKTFSNPCEADCHKVKHDMIKNPNGECEDDLCICNENYDPVCGFSDLTKRYYTYDNECDMLCQDDVDFVYDGVCEDYEIVYPEDGIDGDDANGENQIEDGSENIFENLSNILTYAQDSNLLDPSEAAAIVEILASCQNNNNNKTPEEFKEILANFTGNKDVVKELLVQKFQEIQNNLSSRFDYINEKLDALLAKVDPAFVVEDYVHPTMSATVTTATTKTTEATTTTIGTIATTTTTEPEPSINHSYQLFNNKYEATLTWSTSDDTNKPHQCIYRGAKKNKNYTPNAFHVKVSNCDGNGFSKAQRKFKLENWKSANMYLNSNTDKDYLKILTFVNNTGIENLPNSSPIRYQKLGKILSTDWQGKIKCYLRIVYGGGPANSMDCTTSRYYGSNFIYFPDFGLLTSFEMYKRGLCLRYDDDDVDGGQMEVEKCSAGLDYVLGEIIDA